MSALSTFFHENLDLLLCFSKSGPKTSLFMGVLYSSVYQNQVRGKWGSACSGVQDKRETEVGGKRFPHMEWVWRSMEWPYRQCLWKPYLQASKSNVLHLLNHLLSLGFSILAFCRLHILFLINLSFLLAKDHLNIWQEYSLLWCLSCCYPGCASHKRQGAVDE